MAAVDNGLAPDGCANDGVYSVDYKFGSAGLYNVEGNVVIATSKGPVRRSATAQVRVVPPQMDTAGTALATMRGEGNCIAALVVSAGFKVRKAARYSTLIRLDAPNGKHIDIRKAADHGVGTAVVMASFSAHDIETKLDSDGPYRVSRVEVLELGHDEFRLAYRELDAGVFEGRLTALCQPIVNKRRR